jgi:hypothetical protein
MRAWTTRFASLAIFAALLGASALPLPAAAGDEGFLYGRLTTRDGTTYEGRLRWDDEEAFWGDFFNSSKEDNPWVDEAPRFGSTARATTSSCSASSSAPSATTTTAGSSSRASATSPRSSPTPATR